MTARAAGGAPGAAPVWPWGAEGGTTAGPERGPGGWAGRTGRVRLVGLVRFVGDSKEERHQQCWEGVLVERRFMKCREDPLLLLLVRASDIIRTIRDPEKPNTLEELEVVTENCVEVQEIGEDEYLVIIRFTPTVPHCSLATLIGEIPFSPSETKSTRNQNPNQAKIAPDPEKWGLLSVCVMLGNPFKENSKLLGSDTVTSLVLLIDNLSALKFKK